MQSRLSCMYVHWEPAHGSKSLSVTVVRVDADSAVSVLNVYSRHKVTPFHYVRDVVDIVIAKLNANLISIVIY